MAVCEKPDRTMLNIPRKRLPTGAHEGDVLIVEGNTILLDLIETARRRKSAADTLKNLRD